MGNNYHINWWPPDFCTINSSTLDAALSTLHDNPGMARELAAYSLQMLHGIGMSSLLVIVRYMIQQHPKLLDHPLFAGELGRLGRALQTAGYGPLEYEKGFTIYLKRKGELLIRPQLFPRCFTMALALAKAVARLLLGATSQGSLSNNQYFMENILGFIGNFHI